MTLYSTPFKKQFLRCNPTLNERKILSSPSTDCALKKPLQRFFWLNVSIGLLSIVAGCADDSKESSGWQTDYPLFTATYKFQVEVPRERGRSKIFKVFEFEKDGHDIWILYDDPTPKEESSAMMHSPMCSACTGSSP